MGATAKALGMGAQLEFEGKTYTLSGYTEGVKALYELYLERHAMSKARKLRDYVSPVDLAEKDPVDGARRDITIGFYSFGTKAFRDSLQSMTHLKTMILFQLQENHPEVTAAMVERMFEKALDDVIFAYQEADNDPNGKTPAASGAAGE